MRQMTCRRSYSSRTLLNVPDRRQSGDVRGSAFRISPKAQASRKADRFASVREPVLDASFDAVRPAAGWLGKSHSYFSMLADLERTIYCTKSRERPRSYIGDRRMRIGDVQKPASDFLCKAPDPGR